MKEDAGDRPLWGNHWRYGSFWDDLSRLRARIKTVSVALADSEGEMDFLKITLDDILTEMEELSQKARQELESN
jgi:hypothetical protein